MSLKDGLTGSLIIRNGDIYNFCWRQAIMSVLPLVDEFILLEAYSDLDNTYEECLALERMHGKIRVIRGKWDGGEPEGHEYLRLSRLTNQCIGESAYKWHIVVQGDEAVHEDGWPSIMRIVNGQTEYGDKPKAVMFPFHHLVGRFDTEFPFVYQATYRMCRADSSWRSNEDAWNMEPLDEDDNFWIVANNAPYFHYGFVGDLEARVLKERAFQDMFKSKGFPDPRVVAMAEGSAEKSMAYLFADAKEKGLFVPLKKEHPIVMRNWIEAHRQYEEVF